MKSICGLMLIASGLGVVCLADHHTEDWPVREQETTSKTLSIAGSPMRLLVENVEGYVHLTTIGGSQVHVKTHKTIRADTDADLKAAKAEVKLSMSEQPGSVAISYDAPWICRNGPNCQDHNRRFYRVVYDIDLEVPRGVRPFLSTVTGGDVVANGTSGDFEFKNVNGAITATGLSGSGKIHTVNGPIVARFLKSPEGASSFATVNGQLDAYFPADLSADLRFKTLNGEIFSDFEVSALPVPEAAGERLGGRFVYRSNGLKGARAGKGGPELTFNTVNGSIRLHRNGQAVAMNGALNND